MREIFTFELHFVVKHFLLFFCVPSLLSFLEFLKHFFMTFLYHPEQVERHDIEKKRNDYDDDHVDGDVDE